MKQLQARGIDVIHVGDVGLLKSDDVVIFDWARRENRIIVTRNYQDFAPLVEQAARQQLRSPGVLFCAQSLPQSDVGRHVRALERWLANAQAAGANPVESTFGWLR
jgi:predicted nuclease of predicted toxin-antitoxin system